MMATDDKEQTKSDGNNGWCPPNWTGTTPLPINEVRTYWYGRNPLWKTQPHEPQYMVISRPAYPIWPADQSDTEFKDAIRVVSSCIIEIYLSDVSSPYGMGDLQFDQNLGGITFQSQESISQYYNLNHLIDLNGRAHGVSFAALYRGGAWILNGDHKLVRSSVPWTMDKFDFHLTCYPACEPTGGKPCPKCATAIPFDPGVCNPGDDPNGQGNNPPLWRKL